MDVVKRLKPMMAELEIEDNILIISHQATLRYQRSERVDIDNLDEHFISLSN